MVVDINIYINICIYHNIDIVMVIVMNRNTCISIDIDVNILYIIYIKQSGVINMSRVIAIAIQKGGSGKTTTVLNLASCLSNKGKKVLVIDCDVQGNLTYACGVDENPNLGTYEVMKKICNPHDAIIKLEEFDIIPSNERILCIDYELVMSGREYTLKNSISDIREEYDYILIDCPPSLSVTTINAITASDYVIVPVEPSYFALQGLDKLSENVRAVYENTSTKVKILGMLLIKYNSRTILNRSIKKIADDMASELGTKIFKTKIHESTVVKEAQSLQVSLRSHAPNSKPYKDYMEFTNELMRECGDNE